MYLRDNTIIEMDHQEIVAWPYAGSICFKLHFIGKNAWIHIIILDGCVCCQKYCDLPFILHE